MEIILALTVVLVAVTIAVGVYAVKKEISNEKTKKIDLKEKGSKSDSLKIKIYNNADELIKTINKRKVLYLTIVKKHN